MQKVILIIMLLCSSSLIFSQKKLNNVDVENIVDFYKDSSISDFPVDAVHVVLKVTNKTNHTIPNLGTSNRIKHVNLYINGNVNNPLNLYNGIESSIDTTIRKNASQTFITYRDIGYLVEKYGNKFTVQWEYMGKRSALLQVDVEKKETYIIRQCLIAQ